MVLTKNTGDLKAEGKPLSGHRGLWCRRGLDDDLAEQLIARTLDPDDVRLREMTHDLSRFSSNGRLARWRPGRDLVCLQDAADVLLGIVWVARKPMPERDDYFDPEQALHGPPFTWAIRTYGEARGHGLAYAFSEHALDALLSDRPEGPAVWYETKAANTAARRLGATLGFSEVSGEADGTVVGVRFSRGGLERTAESRSRTWATVPRRSRR